MAFKFTDENGKNISMAKATQMLENALDKTDNGEQIINGVVKVEDNEGNPIEVTDENQIITKKYIDDLYKSYITLNISIPFNIDIDSEIIISSVDSPTISPLVDSPSYSYNNNFTVFYCKTNARKSINCIHIPRQKKYIIQYVSYKTWVFQDFELNIEDQDISVCNITLNPLAKLDKFNFPTEGSNSYFILRQSNANNSLNPGGVTGGICNGYFYSMIMLSCDNIIIPPNKDIEIFLLGAGQTRTNQEYLHNGSVYGGKRKYITVNTQVDTLVSILIGASNWDDSVIKIGDTTYSTDDSTEYAKTMDYNGILPFNEDAFIHKYGAASDGDTGGGGTKLPNVSNKRASSGFFFGAGGNTGFQGIVIMRWKVDEEV